MLPLKDELTLLECKLPLELIASHWPPFREQWRFRVAQAASVAQLGGLVFTSTRPCRPCPGAYLAGGPRTLARAHQQRGRLPGAEAAVHAI